MNSSKTTRSFVHRFSETFLLQGPLREEQAKIYDETEFLRRFHQGERTIMEECYRNHFDMVYVVVGKFLSGADRETVVQEFFLRMLDTRSFRSNFKGGSFSSWLATAARNMAIDFVRRHSREIPENNIAELDCRAQEGFESESEARILIERFRRDILPRKWDGVFEKRFLNQLGQREAAEALSISRTTLAYQEVRVRSLLKKFLIDAEDC